MRAASSGVRKGASSPRSGSVRLVKSWKTARPARKSSIVRKGRPAASTATVVAEERGRVDSRQDGRLPRGALRPPLDAERRVGSDEHAVARQARLFRLED